VFYVATGWFLLLIPGLISLLLFTEHFTFGQPLENLRPKNGQFAIGGIPFFTWTIYLGISWSSCKVFMNSQPHTFEWSHSLLTPFSFLKLGFGFLYAFHVLPDILVRLADVFIEATLNK
jgi:hypothetical protein